MGVRKMKIGFRFLFILLFIKSFFVLYSYSDDACPVITDNYQGSCYMAYDYGFTSSSIIINSKCPCSDNDSIPGNCDCTNSKKESCGQCKWKKFDPTFYTKGNSSLESNANNIAITVEGAWKPWGDLEISGKMCGFNPCEVGAQDCYLDGKQINIGNKQVNVPCCVKDGYGIYGLIALNNKNPNDYQVLDNVNFRTFRVGPLKVSQYKPSTNSGDDSKDVTIKTYVVEHVEKWDADSQTFAKEPIPAGGTLYFKIEDSYYRDNVGSYKIKLDNGAFIKKKGLIEKLIEFFKDTFAKVQKVIYDNIVKDSGFRTIARILLVLFVIFSVVFFMLGLIEINQTELIVRLFKIGVIATVISDSTLGAIPNLFQGIINSTINISTVIMQSSIFDPITNQPLLPFSDLSTVFSAYDGVIEMVTSKAFNYKILGILFTSRFYLIIGIYICVILMFIGMWKSLVQYIMSFFLLALLVILLPIFIVTILFKQTIHFFDQWLEQFIGSCIMLIVVTATVALMLSFIITQLQDMLYYTVCWETIFSWKPLGITIIDFKFWKASSWDEFTKAVTPKNFFYVLISCVLFRVYIDYVPELVDALGGVARRPLSGVYGGMMESADGFMRNQIYGSRLYKALDRNILSPIKQRVGLLHYVDRASNKAFGTKKDSAIVAVRGLQKLAKDFDDKYSITTHKGQDNAGRKGMWDQFTGDIHGELGVYDVKEEEAKVYEKLEGLKAKGKDFAEEFGKLKQALKDRRVRKIEGQNRGLMKNMLDEDKNILDKSVENLDVRHGQLKTEKSTILDSKQLLKGKLDEIERGQNKLNQGEAEFDQARQSLDDIQRNDAELMTLKDQRDPFDVNKVEERYQALLQEKYGDQERGVAEKQQQIEQDRGLLEQGRENYTQQLEMHQQNVEDYQRSVSAFEENRNLVQQQYELYEEQERVLDGGVSRYEVEEGLNRTQEEMSQTVDSFQSKQQELSNSQAQLEEQLRQLDELNKQLEQQKQLSEQLSQEMQKSKDEPGDQDEGERLRLNDALEKRYTEQQVQVEQLQTELDQGKETYNQNYEYQAQEYNQYSQDMARTQDEVSSTQQLYEQRQSELEGYQSSVAEKWDSSELYLEPKPISDQDAQQQDVRHKETAMEKIAKIQEENERYQQKMVQMKKLEEEIFEESRRIK